MGVNGNENEWNSILTALLIMVPALLLEFKT